MLPTMEYFVRNQSLSVIPGSLQAGQNLLSVPNTIEIMLSNTGGKAVRASNRIGIRIR